MDEKIYTCECGKTFTKPNSFNGHKSSCKIHALTKGTWEQVRQQHVRAGNATAAKYAPMIKARKEQKAQEWANEQHVCETCGKIMSVKYGCGRFCSQSCANSHPKDAEARSKIGAALKNSDKQKQNSRAVHEAALAEYNKNPKLCVVCGCVLPYQRRERRTCSKLCYSKVRSDVRFNTIQKLGLNHGKHQLYKFGFYKGVECDSSWELAFLLYHIEHKSNIKRNTDCFEYQFEGSLHRYYPDFQIDDVYYEIKGYKDARFFGKTKQFPTDKSLIVVDYTDINKYIKFAVDTFGADFATIYDNDKPNWMKSIKDC